MHRTVPATANDRSSVTRFTQACRLMIGALLFLLTYDNVIVLPAFLRAPSTIPLQQVEWKGVPDFQALSVGWGFQGAEGLVCKVPKSQAQPEMVLPIGVPALCCPLGWHDTTFTWLKRSASLLLSLLGTSPRQLNWEKTLSSHGQTQRPQSPQTTVLMG